MDSTLNPYVEQSLTKSNEVTAMNQNDLNGISQLINSKISEFLKLPSNQNMQNVDWSSIKSILSLISTTLITVFLTLFFLWLMRSIGLYVMAKKREDKLAFLAFIPYAHLYTLGKITGKTRIYGVELSKPEYALPLLILSMYLPFSAAIAVMLFVLVYNALLYRIYQEQCPNFAVILVFFSVILPFLVPFFLFFIRKNNFHGYEN